MKLCAFYVLKERGVLLITLCNGRNGETNEEIKELITYQLLPSMRRA